jgi:hypothetical protein
LKITQGIDIRIALGRRRHLIDVFLEVGEFGFAHRFMKLILKLRRHPPDFRHPLPERSQRAGKFLRPDDDQRNDTDQDKLSPPEIEH